MRQYVEEIARISEIYVSCYPNAGLPNEFGEYDDSPEHMSAVIADWCEQGWVNLVGGCCGTTPEHIKAIAEEAAKHTPRAVPQLASVS
jgi:5-methyltetrahydrofolate--homocysteine methyltransferase